MIIKQLKYSVYTKNLKQMKNKLIINTNLKKYVFKKFWKKYDETW